MHWPFLPFLLQFAMGNYTQNWIKHETDCCKNRTFYSSFFVPKFRKDVAQWQTETAPIRCNFISLMMSSTFSLPNSKHLLFLKMHFHTWLTIHSCPNLHFHITFLCEPIDTSVGLISFSSDHSEANSGFNVFKSLIPSFTLAPEHMWHFSPLERAFILVSHSWPQAPFHHTLLFEPKVMLSGVSGKFFSDHSATNSGCTVANLLLISKPPFPLWLEYMRFWLLLVVYECW